MTTQAPIINLVLLGLLILFFGIQQRTRTQASFRFWFAGWVLVLLSYAVWDMHTPGVDLGTGQEILRIDLLLLGSLAFLFSFTAYRGSMRRTLQFMVGVWVVACVGTDLEIWRNTSLWLEGPLILTGEAAGIWAAWELLPPKLKGQRLPLTVLCCVFGLGLVLTARGGGRFYIQDLVLMQVFESVAILYAGASMSGRLVRLAGFLGFAAWAMEFPVSDLLRSNAAAIHLMYSMWDLPKYMAAFAMTLEIFEASRAEVEQLADGYKVLYEDFRVLYDHHPHPMWIYDAMTRRFLSANRATLKAYGYSESELLRMSVAQFLAPVEEDEAEAHGLTRRASESRQLHRHRDGQLVAVEVTEGRILFQGEQARVVLAVDVTERERLDQELFFRAHHDVLTGLPNRQLLEDRIAHVLSRAHREARKAVVLTIDVDHFKRINDTWGHPAGDECLKAVAIRLQSRIRQVDTIARTGGEEFTAVIGGLSSQEDAMKIAQSLLEAFRAPILLPECSLPITVSIGGAIYPDDATDGEELRRLSDEALYAAKESGRNRAVFAGESDLSRGMRIA